jgi:hypothetical protein
VLSPVVLFGVEVTVAVRMATKEAALERPLRESSTHLFPKLGNVV